MKNNYFYKKNIIITGASQGIGNAVANFFYSKGSNLILCARNKKRLISSDKSAVDWDKLLIGEKLSKNTDLISLPTLKLISKIRIIKVKIREGRSFEALMEPVVKIALLAIEVCLCSFWNIFTQ